MKLVLIIFAVQAVANAGLVIPQPQLLGATSTAYSTSYSRSIVAQPQISAPVIQNLVPQYSLEAVTVPSTVVYHQLSNRINPIAEQQVEYQEQGYNDIGTVNRPRVSQGLAGIEYVNNNAEKDRRQNGKYWVTDSDGTRRQVEYSASDLNGVLEPKVPSVSLVSPQSLYNGQTKGVTQAFYEKKTPLAQALSQQQNLEYQLQY